MMYILNSFVYSLRNKDIKRSLKRLLETEIIKVHFILRLNKCPWLEYSKSPGTYLGFLDQKEEVEIVLSNLLLLFLYLYGEKLQFATKGLSVYLFISLFIIISSIYHHLCIYLSVYVLIIYFYLFYLFFYITLLFTSSPVICDNVELSISGYFTADHLLHSSYHSWTCHTLRNIETALRNI
jgi:hypothetical protein